MRACKDGAVVFRIAAQTGHFLLQAGGDFAAFGGAAGKERHEATAFAVLGGFGIAIGAVDRGGNQTVEGRNIVAVVGHDGSRLER